MKHVQSYTKFINESEYIPPGVEEVLWDVYHKAGTGKILTEVDIEKLESLREMTGAVNRHDHMKNKTTSQNEYIICKSETPHSYIPPVAKFGTTSIDTYKLVIDIKGGIGDQKYYFSPTLEPLIGIVLKAFRESDEFTFKGSSWAITSDTELDDKLKKAELALRYV